MKRKLFFLPILLFITCFISCNKINELAKDVKKDMALLSLLSYTPNQGYIAILANRGHGGTYSPVSYVFTGRIYSDTSQVDSFGVDGGLVSVNNISTTSNSNNNNYYTAILQGASSVTNAQGCFGTNATFDLGGNSTNGIDAFSQQMYVPAEIILNRNHCRSGIRKGLDLLVEWNQDASNTYGVDIVFEYDGFLSHAKDPMLSATSIKLAYHVTDNGQYTIPQSAFANFPVTGEVILSIGRGNSQWVTTTNSQVYQLVAVTSAMYTDVLIP